MTLDVSRVRSCFGRGDLWGRLVRIMVKWACVSSPALPFVAHSLSSRLQLAPLHCCCCSWWLSHNTGISKTVLSSAAIGLHFHQYPLIGSLHGTEPQLLCTVPSIPSTADEAAPSPIASPGSSHAMSPLLSMTPHPF